ncbi:MAG: amidase [Dehalococcoidia bacterium]
MTTSTDLCFLSLDELSRRIAAKDVSPVEATEASLARIEQLNPTLNAFITVMAEQAMAAARAAADEIAAGKRRGPLHGVPVGVKDLCATKGVRTTAGSKILAESVPDEDSALIEKLREAGAVVVGKTHLHEFAFGATGINPHFGPCHNPWDTSRITGGSSSGSAVSVASGMCYAAIGSDTGGSVRIPASLCGLTGIKPTYGRVSVRGTLPLSWSLDHLGPMARSARDCALVLAAIAGYDAQDELSVDAPVDDYAAKIDGGIAGLRVGVVTNAFADVQPDVASNVRAAIDVLAQLGAQVREIELPQVQELWGATSAILVSEAAAYHKENFEQRPADIGDDVLLRLQWGMDVKAVDYVRAMRLMREVRATCDETLLRDVDLLAMPTTIIAAVPIEAVTKEDPTLGLTRLTAAFDVTGQPAASVPCGFTSEGLPVGLQLIGRHFDEATVLRAAHSYEEARGPWPQPPVDA